jgi:hypothetical protein
VFEFPLRTANKMPLNPINSAAVNRSRDAVWLRTVVNVPSWLQHRSSQHEEIVGVQATESARNCLATSQQLQQV